MKVYTRTGDHGTTSLFGQQQRVPKTHPRVQAYGAVDELNATLAMASVSVDDDQLLSWLGRVQARLFDIGADLATPADAKTDDWLKRVPDEWVTALEAEIDAMTEELPPLTAFILPGGTPGAAALHLARTVCRRAEREVIAAREAGEVINPEVAVYLNRLSDWLFTAARLFNARSGVAETRWRRGGAAPSE